MIYEHNNKIYEWDDNKARLNKIKHNVSFKYAVKVFDDKNKLIRYDDKHSFEEDRWQVLGKVDDILFVVYTECENTRIISARRATKSEEEEYYGK